MALRGEIWLRKVAQAMLTCPRDCRVARTHQNEALILKTQRVDKGEADAIEPDLLVQQTWNQD